MLLFITRKKNKEQQTNVVTIFYEPDALTFDLFLPLSQPVEEIFQILPHLHDGQN